MYKRPDDLNPSLINFMSESSPYISALALLGGYCLFMFKETAALNNLENLNRFFSYNLRLMLAGRG